MSLENLAQAAELPPQPRPKLVPIPNYSALSCMSVMLNLVGIVVAASGVLWSLQLSNVSPLFAFLICCSSIGTGLLFMAIAAGCSALRDIAQNSFRLRKL